MDRERGRQAKALTDGRHSIPATSGGWSVVPGAGVMMLQFDEPTRFGDVWTLPLPGAGSGGANAEPRPVTGIYDAPDRDVALPRQERMEWKSADGTTTEGLLFYPIGYTPGTRYPLVVQLHGGPMESDQFGVGENDARVPLPQSIEMSHALKSLGVPTHLRRAARRISGRDSAILI